MLHHFFRRLWRLALRALAWPVALVVVFEEWGWEPLQRVLARVGQWPGFRWMEAWVRSLPPWGALALFAAPSLALLPIKLLALWAISHGHVVLGMAVVIGTKLAGTAVVARLFTLTRPALMQMPWFARLWARWSHIKAQLLALARASWPWRVARVLKRQWSMRWRRWQG